VDEDKHASLGWIEGDK